MKKFKQLFSSLNHSRFRTQRLPELGAQSHFLRDHHGQGFQWRHAVKELVNLKCSHQALVHTQMRGQLGNVLAFQKNLSRGGIENASHQIDQGGFASAIGANQGVPCALV